MLIFLLLQLFEVGADGNAPQQSVFCTEACISGTKSTS